MSSSHSDIYSIIIAVHPEQESASQAGQDWRLGDITVDWVDFTREKSTDRAERAVETHDEDNSDDTTEVNNKRTIPGSMTTQSKPKPRAKTKPRRRRQSIETPESLSLQPLLALGPHPVDASSSSGVTIVGNGVVHLFRHAPPASLIARLEGQNGESSAKPEGWAGEHAEGEDGSLVAILAVPAWMRPADLLEFLGGWVTCLEGVRMIREANTPNRSIVLLKFRDPLQASDFMVIFTGRAFSTLDSRETCHLIRVHHLVLHRLEERQDASIAIPAFPPGVYASRARGLPDLLTGIPPGQKLELPSCPVCLERLDSSITGLVTLPCAHTFDCDCLRKWGDSRCPVCRVSHLLLQSGANPRTGRDDVTRLTQCGMCDSTNDNWICVVCGSVGCGRYSKGHARHHWKETGHQLSMELETQRVWDYKGDNYVHRLIQSRTDGKLVELPSASSLTTLPARPMPLNRPLSPSPRVSGELTRPSSGDNMTMHGRTDSGGPSSGDVEKMSTIESITLEYSYLLSSQLESMRQHYEAEAVAHQRRIAELEIQAARSRELEEMAETAAKEREEAEKAREKAERRADKALELARGLQSTLGSERAMSQGLQARVGKLKEDLESVRAGRNAKAAEVEQLNETVRDLMFTLEAGVRIQEEGEGEGGDLVVVGGKRKGKKK